MVEMVGGGDSTGPPTMTTVEEQEARLAQIERGIQEGSIRPVLLHSGKAGVFCRTCRQTIAVAFPGIPEKDAWQRSFDEAAAHAQEFHLYALGEEDFILHYWELIGEWIVVFGPSRSVTAFNVAGPEEESETSGKRT